jgi:hypothetical protein
MLENGWPLVHSCAAVAVKATAVNKALEDLS